MRRLLALTAFAFALAWQATGNGLQATGYGLQVTGQSKSAPAKPAAPPVARGPQPVASFDSAKAWEHLRQMVTLGPRPAGSPALRQTRAYITRQLSSIGLTVQEQPFAAETPLGKVEMVNLVAKLPRRHAFIRIRVPGNIHVEVLNPRRVPGWDKPDMIGSRSFGDRWYDERRTAVLFVPSAVTMVERNILINQRHPDFKKIRASAPVPVQWDRRLFE